MANIRRLVGRSLTAMRTARRPSAFPMLTTSLMNSPRIRSSATNLLASAAQCGRKYIGRRRQPPSQTWRTFLRNHLAQIVAADFFVVPTVTYRLLFVFVLLAHDRQRIRHIAVTAHPTAAWTAQQLREAFPWDEAPRYLLHDRDHVFDGLGATAKAMGIEEVLTAPRAPWQNAFVERFIGSARRECFDHVIVFNEAGLHRLMTCYCSYHERSRTHLSLDKDTPIPRPVTPPADGAVVVAIPEVGGLHHRYERRAA
jgi:putative transposase